MTKLFLDFETASVLDLRKVGLDNYAKHPSTHPLMLGWAFDDDEISLWEPHTGPIPPEVDEALKSDVMLVSWNVPFERNIFHQTMNRWLDYPRWLDVMIWARHLSLPGSLEKAGLAIGLPPSLTKTQDGKRLIKKFSEPFHKGGEETLFGISEPRFHNGEDEPADWKLFGDYCKQDVASERAIFRLVENIPLPESERRAWILDQRINDRGIPINRKFVQNALTLSLESKRRLTAKLKEMTGLVNPNSRNQFLGWAQKHNYPHLSLGKNFVTAALADDSGIPTELRTALKLRQEASKTSYCKFQTLLNVISEDDRLRNALAFLGASRTGRWSGKTGGDKDKGVQVHNLPKPTKEVEKKYERALEIIDAGDYDAAEKEFSSVIGMTVSCIRSAIQAHPGKKLVVCDLGSIENRALGWLAECDAILKVFRDGRDAYLDFAARMYNVLYESIIKIIDGVHKPKDADAAEKRQVAKAPVLGAGYGLGPGVKKHADGTYEIIYVKDRYGNEVMSGLMGYAANMGVKLTAEQAYTAWETFRKSYPEVVQLWKKYEKAAVRCLETGVAVRVGVVLFQRRKRKDGTFILRIQLPGGRGLHYINARIELETLNRQSDGEEYDRKKIMYDGIGHGVGQIVQGWGKVYTYGGKLTENIDQAISRDILVNGMTLADEMNASIVMHVHDEIVCEEDDDPFSFGISDLKNCMESTPEWAEGLFLGAEGWEGRYYKK